ncbi:hypothetical protein QVD17_26455 [Tagetes erecta]|uniref:Uncharacterized protein n=1 Tax=Tagetes erecta TaxID=13708 RepID=A0AAD8K7G1_TARER|nr:hypothetical protein QVD17_26455 [Tagetes erecta]
MPTRQGKKVGTYERLLLRRREREREVRELLLMFWLPTADEDTMTIIYGFKGGIRVGVVVEDKQTNYDNIVDPTLCHPTVTNNPPRSCFQKSKKSSSHSNVPLNTNLQLI